MSREEKLDKLNAEIASLEKEVKEVKGTECEVYARITGYYRSIKNWNKGKQAEYKERTEYDVSKAKKDKAA